MELIMEYLHNYFYRFKEKGTFLLTGKEIERADKQFVGRFVVGQYIRIKGSVANDGVYKITGLRDNIIVIEGDLSEETFGGYICSLGVPKAFVGLSSDIQDYNKEHKTEDIISESFGGYSYTRANSSVSGLTGWQLAFKSRLAPYRRMSDGFLFVKEYK